MPNYALRGHLGLVFHVQQGEAEEVTTVSRFDLFPEN